MPPDWIAKLAGTRTSVAPPVWDVVVVEPPAPVTAAPPLSDDPPLADPPLGVVVLGVVFAVPVLVAAVLELCAVVLEATVDPP